MSVAEHAVCWHEALQRIQEQPLTCCAAFPSVARRWREWWTFRADRPLLLAQAPKVAGIRWDKAFDLIDRPDEWVAVQRRKIASTHYVGEALPFARIDIGPVATAAFLGAPLHLAAAEQTSWQMPTVDAWPHPMRLETESADTWLGKVLRLIACTAADARGAYLVGLPDLTGAIDVLANMRTPEKLCLDLFERRAAVLAAAEEVVTAWESVFVRMYDTVLGAGAGITQWICCWADVPFTVPTCDFNALIGPSDFDAVCLPSLAEQARRAGRCVFHLDGPAAARHAPALAETPEITAVQYTPGAGTPSVLAMLPMFRMLQAHRKPLFIETPFEEAQALAGELDPAGLAIRVASGIETPAQADALFEWRERAFA
jgi:hypothetical protein